MIERRDLLKTVGFVGALSATQGAAACTIKPPKPDPWGKKLIAYLRDGDEAQLEGAFADYTSLYVFGGDIFPSSPKHFFDGPGQIVGALKMLRESEYANGLQNSVRKMTRAVFRGSPEQGETNKIEITFAQDEYIETTCGPTNFASDIDIFYESPGYDVPAESSQTPIRTMILMRRFWGADIPSVAHASSYNRKTEIAR